MKNTVIIENIIGVYHGGPYIELSFTDDPEHYFECIHVWDYDKNEGIPWYEVKYYVWEWYYEHEQLLDEIKADSYV